VRHTVTLDFASALYLGLSHPSRYVPPWSALTLGTPAAIREPQLARDVAAGVARLVGADDAVIGTSTLHIALDLFPLLAPRGATIYTERSLYPIAMWGIDRARSLGARVRSFPTHDPVALRAMLERDAPFSHPPVVVCDGLCPSCGRVAPLAAYARLAHQFGGRLVIDDTQALGVLGTRDDDNPYGRGGGGSLRHLGVRDPRIVIIASLAKGFGAPLAVLATDAALTARFRSQAPTREHCSPPSIPTLLAADRALRINRSVGDRIRDRLASLVARFRAPLAATGLLATHWLFPVQPLRLPPNVDAVAMYRALVAAGIQAVPTRNHDGATMLTFVITAAHDEHAIDIAAARVRAVLDRATHGSHSMAFSHDHRFALPRRLG